MTNNKTNPAEKGQVLGQKSYRLPNGVIRVRSSSDFLDLMDDCEKEFEAKQITFKKKKGNENKCNSFCSACNVKEVE